MSHLGARKPCEPGGARKGTQTRTRERDQDNERAAAVAERERPLLRTRPWDILEGGGATTDKTGIQVGEKP